MAYPQCTSTASAQWNKVREMLIPNVSPSSKAAQGRWDIVREAFCEETAKVEPPLKRVTMQHPMNEEISMQTQRKEVQTQRKETIDTAEATSSRGVSDWGSSEDVEELNRDILSCLEVEEIRPPENLFIEKVENFTSVAHYYVHAMKMLDGTGIDLLASLAQRFGEEHSLVKGMRTVLYEESNKTYMTREPTDVQETLKREGSGIAVPGFTKFSEETRSLSLVMHPPATVHPKPGVNDPYLRKRLSTVRGSRASGSFFDQSNDGQKGEPGPIICPGLPVSFDGIEQQVEQPPTPAIVVLPPKSKSRKKKTFFDRFMGCFCFSA